MPIPKPVPSESVSKFVTRCMDDPVMKREYPDQKQRAAVCYQQTQKKARK